MKKKGFTLIELLAVIVILAIIVVVTVPTVLNSIDDARLSSLHSLSKEVASWYDKTIAQDMLVTDVNKKTLGGIVVTDEWQCLRDVKNSKGQNLAEIYGLSDDDLIILNRTGESNVAPEGIGFNLDEDSFAENVYGECSECIGKDVHLCSAIKVENNKAVVLLVSRKDGKFDTNGTCGTHALNIGQNAFDSQY